MYESLLNESRAAHAQVLSDFIITRRKEIRERSEKDDSLHGQWEVIQAKCFLIPQHLCSTADQFTSFENVC